MKYWIKSNFNDLKEQNHHTWKTHILINRYFGIEESADDIQYSFGSVKLERDDEYVDVVLKLGHKTLAVRPADGEMDTQFFDSNMKEHGNSQKSIIDHYEIWYKYFNDNTPDLISLIPLLIHNEELYFAALSYKTPDIRRDLQDARPFLIALLATIAKDEFFSHGTNHQLEYQESTGLISSHAVVTGFDNLKMPYIEIFHQLANTRYEGSANNGVIHFVKDRHCPVTMNFSKKNTGFFSSENRTLRKYLQVSTEELPLIAKYRGWLEPHQCYWYVEGYGLQDHSNIDATIKFLSNGSWECICRKERILYNGCQYMIYEKIDEKKQDNKCKKEFEEKIVTEFAGQPNLRKIANKLWDITDHAKEQVHGTLLVFMSEEHISAEVDRLSRMDRAIPIEAFDLSKGKKSLSIIKAMTSIDGAMMVDLEGNCHAIGVILDGSATIRSNKGRGARYNSALAYVHDRLSNNMDCAAVVISEDRMNDIIISKNLPEELNKADSINKMINNQARRRKDVETCGCCGRTFPAGEMWGGKCTKCARELGEY